MAWSLVSPSSAIVLYNWTEFVPGIYTLGIGEVGLIRIAPIGSLGITIDGIFYSWNNIETVPEGTTIVSLDKVSGASTLISRLTPALNGNPISFPISNPPITQATVNWQLYPTGLDNNIPDWSNAPTYPQYPTLENGSLIGLNNLILWYQIINTGSGAITIGISDITAPITITGTESIITPPVYPDFVMSGGIDLGGGATIQALTDASGIYTLIPGQYHDELYQRVGTTASTINVVIPTPFFKTGFIKG